MIHQMNRLGVARRAEDPEDVRRGPTRSAAPPPGTDAGGAPRLSALVSRSVGRAMEPQKRTRLLERENARQPVKHSALLKHGTFVGYVDRLA